MTLVVFAKLLGISQGSLSNIENGVSKPSADTISSIVRHTNIDPTWFLTGEERQDQPAQKPAGKVMALIEKMLVDMDEEAQREVLKYAEEKKLIADLLAGKKRRRKASGE